MIQKQSGFSLIELLVTLAVLGVIAALAYPSFQSTITLNRIQSQTSNMLNALLLTRSEAVKANQLVVLCKSTDQSTCSTASTWEKGWIIFRDTNGNNVRDLDPDPKKAEPVIKVSAPSLKKISIRAGAAYTHSLAYRPDGTAGFLLNNTNDQSFIVCYDMNKFQARQIFIDASGRPRVETSGVASCLP
jgi:type IV fimbrial biogenesis protein FimT